MKSLHRVLIANRGEIAIRIRRAIHSRGGEAVAVYAGIDSASLHIQGCDVVRRLPGSGIAPYLDIDAIIAAARDTACNAIHPGYGFLAENAEFAQRCAEEGITFVGPSPSALALFGDKTRARTLAQQLDIPVIPGSEGVLHDVVQAMQAADRVGFPVMLKAAAGGGGRGMRVVTHAQDLAAAFDRASSEALAAFGNGAMFLERQLDRPRHIEVQILGDTTGNLLHLHERDCSVQRRHQKVIEIAPAPNLDPALRDRLLSDAIKLTRTASYVNAGTVEFLVIPESGEYFFIECNPRLQVEHTVTEQITGIDLVEAQLAIAEGATLADLGFASQRDIGPPRGAAVQVRVVATGTGTLTGYKEPSGIGIRVDASAYAGLAPPMQVDPLLAKVIGFSTQRNLSDERALDTALNRVCHAIDEYLLVGIGTNLTELRTILGHPELRNGNARTTFLDEHTNPGKDSTNNTTTVAQFLGKSVTGGSIKPGAAIPQLPVGADESAIHSPMDGALLAMFVNVGDLVRSGATLMVIHAMKMETMITAPATGRVVQLVSLNAEDPVSTGQIVAVLAPSAAEDQINAPAGDASPWQEVLDSVATLQGIARDRLAPDSQESGVVRQRSRGKLTCRERIDLLLDAGSFREIGSLAGFTSYGGDGEISAFTPANHVGGWGEIEGRTTIVCADDFTSRGGHADGAIGAKSMHLDRLSLEMRIPSVRLLDGSSGGGSVAAMVPEQKKDGESRAQESTGAITAGRPRVTGSGGSFLPGHLGSTLYAQQLATVPVVNVLLGSVVGIGAAKAVLGHFSVMVRDIAQLFVAGPPVVRHAMGYDVTKEELGGWHIHCRNGSVDNLAETEADAIRMTQRFLSYLPANAFEAPASLPAHSDDPPNRRSAELATAIPRKRTTTFDIRRVIRLLADRESFFEIGGLWGTDQVVGLARFNGHAVGVIASDSQHVNGGALTADGCRKLTRHLDLCDLFHIPILNLVDNPGFAVGIEHEINGTIRRGGEWMIAFAQTTVPVFTVVMRRSFGVAGNNYATPRAEPSMRVVWPSADVGGIPPEGGIEAAYKRQLAEAADPVAFRAELMARIESARGPIGPLNKFQMEEMIDPRDTRRYVCEWIRLAVQIVRQSERLKPRALKFRP